MEKFEMDGEKTLQLFNNFVGKAKDTLTDLIDDIKSNIKKYEQAIEDTSKEIADSESSREKCEHEITKMEGNIENIKEAIENVENTYKKMVDAYSSTSKGETKEIYSDIIDGAKANCDKDVEKNKTEIARLNSDIEAIKNNITEFTKVIDGLNHDLEGYKLELSKYNKALEYMERSSEKVSLDLDNIAAKNAEPKKKVAETKAPAKKAAAPKKEKEETQEVVIEEEKAEEPVFESLIEKEEFELEEPAMSLEEPKIEEAVVEEPKVEEKPTPEPATFEDSLKQIYDLTGYKPKKEEEKNEEVKADANEDKPVYDNNLENLFANGPKEDVKPEPATSFDENDMSEWERILNGADDIFTNLSSNPVKAPEVPKEEVKTSILDNVEDTVNQLLKPYATSYSKLCALVTNKITYKDGSSIPFELTVEDVIKAVNAIDGTDLKLMKTVGPEITLLRKVKHMKEGKM